MRGIEYKDSLRMRSVQDPVIPVVAELIRANPGTVSLGQGVVNFAPPPAVYEKIEIFQENPEIHKYGPVEGLPELRDKISEKLMAENSISTGEALQVVITAGANMGFLNALFAITDPGDEIILPAPYYFNHEMAVTMLNCKPVPVPTDNDYYPDIKKIEKAITAHTRAVVTVSPNNPTGAVYPRELLTAVNRLCRRHKIYHITDETYEYFTYDGAVHFSPAGLEESRRHTISLFSLSKAYGFASWRIGYMVIPDHLASAVRKIQDTNLICPPAISQYAAIGALEAGRAYCDKKVQSIAEVRTQLLKELETIGSHLFYPRAEGAFYAFLRIDTGITAMEMVSRLIENHGIAVIPGNAFGMERGCYLRISYGALEKETAILGIARLVEGLSEILGS